MPSDLEESTVYPAMTRLEREGRVVAAFMPLVLMFIVLATVWSRGVEWSTGPHGEADADD